MIRTDNKKKKKENTKNTIGTTQTHNFIIDRTYNLLVRSQIHYSEKMAAQVGSCAFNFFFHAHRAYSRHNTHDRIYSSMVFGFFFHAHLRTTVFIDRFHGLRDFRRHFPFIYYCGA